MNAPRSTPLLLTLLLAALLIAPSFMAGPYSFVTIIDNADEVLSSVITSSRESGWFNFWFPYTAAGTDWLAPIQLDHFEWLLFFALPGWLANALYLFAQRFVAIWFTTRLLHEVFQVATLPAMLAGVLFASADHTTWQGMSLTALPMTLWILHRLCHTTRSDAWRYTIALLAGVVYSLSAHFSLSLFVPPLLILWFLFLPPNPDAPRKGWLLLMVWCAGWLLAAMPHLLSSAFNAPLSHRIHHSGKNNLEIGHFYLKFMQDHFPLLFVMLLGLTFATPPARKQFSPLLRLWCTLLVTPTAVTLLNRYGMIPSPLDKFDLLRIEFYFPIITLFSAAVGLNSLKNTWSQALIRRYLLIVSIFCMLALTVKTVTGADIPPLPLNRLPLWMLALPLLLLLFPKSPKDSPAFIRNTPGYLAVGLALGLMTLNPLLAYVARTTEQLKDSFFRGYNYISILDHPQIKQFAARIPDHHTFRVAVIEQYLSSSRTKHTLVPGMFWPHGIETADGYLPLYSYRYHDLWNQLLLPLIHQSNHPNLEAEGFDSWGNRFYLFQPRDMSNPDRQTYFKFKEPYELSNYYNVNLLSLANVRYLFAPMPVSDPRFTPLRTEGIDHPTTTSDTSDWCHGRVLDLLNCLRKSAPPPPKSYYIYENQNALPRVYIVNKSHYFASDPELLTALSHASIQELGSTAFLNAQEVPPILPADSSSPAPTTTPHEDATSAGQITDFKKI
ncbi:MAG: hypothetical protein HQL86_06205, partial [Magnetococcales bacterium]|nr:hypothetical protein [Magnetococcales bacterium]